MIIVHNLKKTRVSRLLISRYTASLQHYHSGITVPGLSSTCQSKLLLALVMTAGSPGNHERLVHYHDFCPANLEKETLVTISTHARTLPQTHVRAYTQTAIATQPALVCLCTTQAL